MQSLVFLSNVDPLDEAGIMFSTMPSSLARGLLERFGTRVTLATDGALLAGAQPVGWAELDGLLPDHGMPRGVVELRAPKALGGGTSIALAVVRAAHLRDARAWCAWVDPACTLYSPGVAMAGVDLNRLAVVRSSRKGLLRTAVKVVRSEAFDVVVIDIDSPPGSSSIAVDDEGPSRRRERSRDETTEVFVRKLALLTAEVGVTAILLTDATIVRSSPLPVALRLELTRTERAISVRVGKDRHGRIGLARAVPFDTKPGLELTG
jgi:hypothetical protein